MLGVASGDLRLPDFNLIEILELKKPAFFLYGLCELVNRQGSDLRIY